MTDSPFNLNGTSTKVKDIITKEIIDDEKMSAPDIETAFDKQISNIINPSFKNSNLNKSDSDPVINREVNGDE